MTTLFPLSATQAETVIANLDMLLARCRRVGSLAADAAEAVWEHEPMRGIAIVQEITERLPEITALASVALMLLRSVPDPESEVQP